MNAGMDRFCNAVSGWAFNASAQVCRWRPIANDKHESDEQRTLADGFSARSEADIIRHAATLIAYLERIA